jgi:iron complex outermembrane receptor protein
MEGVRKIMKQITTSILLFLSLGAAAQVNPDSSRTLKEVVIHPYFSTQPLLRATGSIGLVDQHILGRQPSISLIPAVNTTPGVRMEERSPGSYRLSIRGSLLRSPFGIRNVKLYFDEFPLTDAGGNSYLNALDVNAVGQLQILKGPQSSVYGANSGGVVLINPETPSAGPAANLRVEGGSFGMFHENAAVSNSWKNYDLGISQGYQRSDGYRDHSAMKRNYLQLTQKLRYADNANLKSLFFYSDLSYQTPGGLNAAQFEANPRASRPAAGAIRSAAEQQAGIYSKMLFGGLSNEWNFAPGFRHVAAVYGAYIDFKNPFITNYEQRFESTLGLRTFVEYKQEVQDLKYSFNLGVESTGTASDINNYDNNYGTPAAVQSKDKLRAASNFAFLHANFDFKDKWLLELSASANLYKYDYESLAPVAIAERTNELDVQFMPRVALSYLINADFAWRASVSKGYSPPTIAEIRASDQVINVDLQPESGWNYETGFTLHSRDQRISADVTGFYYRLNNAIVRRLNEDDTEFFVNAGGTNQYGLETSLRAWLLPYAERRFVRGLQLRSAYTLSKFSFRDYLDRTANYSGNRLTGVPKGSIVSSVDMQFPKGLYFFLQHNFTSRIPLNDANSVFADKYHLVQSKIGWRTLKFNKASLDIYAGVDNLFNEKYSLGNDLNAAGNRYFNPAATRNFYGGVAYRFNK